MYSPRPTRRPSEGDQNKPLPFPSVILISTSEFTSRHLCEGAYALIEDEDDFATLLAAGEISDSMSVVGS